VLQSIDGVIVHGVDPDVNRLAATRRILSEGYAHISLSDALPEVDAVVVATPPAAHVAVALEAIEAGKHVLVEKPLAPNARDAYRLVTAAEEAGRVLMVGHTFEYNAGVWKLRELITDGALGRLYYIDSARLNLGLYQGDVNVIWDLAPHDVSIVNYLLGEQPSHVEAWAHRHAHSRLEDVAYLRLHYPVSGVAANIHVSWLDPNKVRRVTAVGSEKMAVFNDMAAEERVRVHDKGVVFTDGEEMSQPPVTYRYGDITAPFVDFREPLRVQDGHFVTCVQTGAAPLTDGRNGLAVVRVLEAAQISLAARRPVALDEVDQIDLTDAGLALRLVGA
jgi:predicted dehydrogenase